MFDNDLTSKSKALCEQMRGVATEIRLRRDIPDALRELDAKACDEAQEIIKKLDTEVHRLRQAIGCFFYGQLTRTELKDIATTWNAEREVQEEQQQS